MTRSAVQRFFEDSFWESVQGRAVSHREGMVPGTERASLLTQELFEFYLASCQSLDDGWVKIILDGLGRAPRQRTRDGHLDLKAVRRAYRNGASLLVTRLQKRREEIAVCCRQIEEAFLRQGAVLTARVGANAYLTPPNSSGFKVHNDSHEVLVMQLEGEKEWDLYHFSSRLPLEGDTSLLENPPEPEQTLTLGPGDLLYVPRGVFHAAKTRARHSLHITFGIHLLTQGELVEKALASLGTLRSDASFDLGKDGAFPPSAELVQGVTRALDSQELAALAKSIRSESVASWDVVPDAHLKSAWSAVDSATALRRATGVFGLLTELGDGSVELLMPGEKIRAPGALKESLDFLLAQDGPFRVEEIPGPLAESGKIELTQQLLNAGFLVVLES